MITATTAVTTAPTALMIWALRQPGSLWRFQCTTMPACDRVNAVNTPKAYNGMILCVSAEKATSTAADVMPRKMMPLENARRSPRKLNCFGMTSSRAITEARVGRPAKAVFAARIKIITVANWMT